jgi:hypothetical protein
MAPWEAEAAVRGGYVDNVLWGSDYPHSEGTWQYSEDKGLDVMTHLALRYAFAMTPPDAVRRMVGDAAIDVFRLDRQRLQAVAARIASPTPTELATPIDAIPDGGGFLAFRQVGPYG